MSIDSSPRRVGQATADLSAPVVIASTQPATTSDALVLDALEQILVELQVMNLLLHSGLSSREDIDDLRSHILLAKNKG